MDTRLKNRIGAAGLVVVALAAAGYFAVDYYPTWRTERENRRLRAEVAKALAADLSNLDADGIEAFVRGLPVKVMTWDEKVAIFDKLRARFEQMPVGERFKLMAKAGEFMEKEPGNPLVANGRELMRAQFHQRMKAYAGAGPEQRQAMLDRDIDEQQARENMRKMGEALGSLMGKKSDDPAVEAAKEKMRKMGPPDDNKIRGFIADAISDSMKTGTPEDRASASQYFLDMRQRRLDRGLPVRF